jgi:hypothetical protein
MNPGKLDAALAMMLESKEQEPNPRLSVFVRTEIGLPAVARSTLKALGIEIAENASVFSADLSKQQVSELSEQPWVKLIRLARATRPFSGT